MNFEKAVGIVKVLDHGHVRLTDYMGSDLAIVRHARASYNAAWRAGEDEGKDAKLLRYLWKNKHTSPFECVVFDFHIQCPIFVARQWHRHRTWAYSEVSARYSELPATFYIPDIDKITTQSTDNKQMRTIEQHAAAGDIQFNIRRQCEESFKLYQHLLASGCARELARGVLPVNTYTHYFGTVNLLNLFKFLHLRLHEHAQYEIRVYAEAILKLIEPLVPVSVAAFLEYR